MNDAERDLRAEAEAFHTAFPEVERLPEEVAHAWEEGQELTEAYLENQLAPPEKAAAPEPEGLPSAPVRGVTRGGGAIVMPEDPFLKGFDEPW